MSGETLERLQELRQQRRQQRKTLEALMGVRQKQREDRVKENKNSPKRQPSPKRQASPKRPQPPNTLPLLEQLSSSSSSLSTLKIGNSKQTLAPKGRKETEFITEALREAVSDFENYLDSSKEKYERPMYRSAARVQRYRQQQQQLQQQQQQQQKQLPSSSAASSPDEPTSRSNFSRYFVNHLDDVVGLPLPYAKLSVSRCCSGTNATKHFCHSSRLAVKFNYYILMGELCTKRIQQLRQINRRGFIWGRLAYVGRCTLISLNTHIRLHNLFQPHT